MAFSAYRMVYAAIWDWRINHIPLNRGSPFAYDGGNVELSDALWTRKVGWGSGGGFHHGHNGEKHIGNGHHHNGTGAYNGVGTSGYNRKPVGGGVGTNAPTRADEMV